MKIINLIFLLSFFLFLTPVAFAASINISTNVINLQSDNEYSASINFSINNSDNKTYYLRGVFYKQGTTNYCGFTWDNNSWFNGPYSSNMGWKNFLPITISNNLWVGQLKAKLDLSDSGCQSSGVYNFKIERFTDGGSSQFDDQNIQTVNVIIPTPTPTLVPTPLPTLTPISQTSNVSPTSNLVIKSTNSKTTLVTIQNKPTITNSQAAITSVLPTENNTNKAVILGIDYFASNAATLSPTPILNGLKKPKIKIKDSQKNYLPLLIIILGLLLIIGCVILFLQIRKKIQNKNEL